jgi:hypothetical protein
MRPTCGPGDVCEPVTTISSIPVYSSSGRPPDEPLPEGAGGGEFMAQDATSTVPSIAAITSLVL